MSEDRQDATPASLNGESPYSLREAASFTGFSEATLRRKAEAGQIDTISESLTSSRAGNTDDELHFAGDDLQRFKISRNGATEKDDQASALPAGDDRDKIIREGTAGPHGASWSVVNSDVIEGLRSMEAASVNCIVTSPPYYWQRDYEVAGQIGHEGEIEEYVDALRDTFKEAYRVLSEDGVFFLNIGDGYYSAKGQPHGKDKKHSARQFSRRKLRAVDGPGLGLPRKSLIGMPWRVALALQEEGWVLRSDIVWRKPAPMPEPTAKDRPWGCHEHVFLFSKNPRYWFNREAMVEMQGHWNQWTLSARPENPGSHFAPYPRALARICVASGCPENGVVLDPFAGSGTTLLEALSRGNDAVGIDIKPEYCQFIEERIESEDWEQAAEPDKEESADEAKSAERSQTHMFASADEG